MYHTMYNTDLGANSIQKPIKDFILDGLLLPAWIALGGGLGMRRGAVVRANIKTILEGVSIGF